MFVRYGVPDVLISDNGPQFTSEDFAEFTRNLDRRNTPTEGLGSSPAQRFLGRRCKTLLPAHGMLLKPQYPTINRQKQRQQQYYDVHTKPLKQLSPGDSVRMWLPGQQTWSTGVCAGLVGPRNTGRRRPHNSREC